MRRIQILGADSPEGTALADKVREALKQLGLEALVELVTDMDVITSYQVMVTPALALDGRLRLVGHKASVEQLCRLLSE